MPITCNKAAVNSGVLNRLLAISLLEVEATNL